MDIIIEAPGALTKNQDEAELDKLQSISKNIR